MKHDKDKWKIGSGSILYGILWFMFSYESSDSNNVMVVDVPLYLVTPLGIVYFCNLYVMVQSGRVGDVLYMFCLYLPATVKWMNGGMNVMV